jgi:hypothetical protein
MAGISFLAVLYAGIGFWAVPFLLKARLPEIVAEQLHGSFKFADARFNPFSGQLELYQAALDTLDGQSALTAEHVVFDVDVTASLKMGYLAVEGLADRVGIRIGLDAKGVSNWTKLIGETDETPSPLIPFMVRSFSIENSTLEFMDERGNVALTAVEVDAGIHDLGPDLSRPAQLELKGSSGGQANLHGKAVLALDPVEITADLHVENFDLIPISAYFEGTGIALKKGTMNGTLAFEYRSIDDGSVLLLVKSNLVGHDVQWRAENGPPADNTVDYIRLDDLEYDGATSILILGKAHLNTLSVPAREGVHVRIGDVDVGHLSVDFSKFFIRADSVGINAINLTQKKGGGRIDAVVSNIRIKGIELGETAMSAKGLGLDSVILHDFSEAADALREIRFGKMSAEGLSADLGKRLLSVDKLDTADAEINARVSPDGRFEIPGLLGGVANGKQADSLKEGWAFSLEEGLIRNYRISLADHSVDPPAGLGFDGLEIRLQGVDTRRGKFTFRLESGVGRRGHITAEGSGKFDPPEADLHLQVEEIGLRPFRPYLGGFARIDLAKGRLNLKGDLAYRPARNDVRFSGMAEIAGLAILDRKEGRDFINWQSLRAEGLTLDTSANRLSIRELIADKPYARIVVSQERTFNLIENLFQPRPGTDSSRPATTPDQAGRPLAVTVGSLLVRNGSADFSDLSLQPSVSVDIHGLTGVIQPLSSKGDAKAEVSIKGSLSDASPVTISGRINPFRIGTFADVSMRFANVDLTELSPYSAKFAGYRIDKGKVDLDLHYRLFDRRLLADNNMVFDHLTLGERVDSPDATSLPVKFAVSLMRGLDGKINIDLPISGDLDDPKFSITGLLAKAAVGAITQVVSSPFSAIGVLFDGGSDDAGSIGFRPGSFELDGAEKIKLDELATALSERPSLSLEIRGTARSGKDANALAEQQLRRQLENAKAIELRLAGGDRDRGPTGPAILSDEDYRRLFSQLYRLRYPEASEWAELPKGERVLSSALFESARRKVLKDWSISGIDLRRLAQARAAGIRSYLMQKGIEPNRIYLLDVELAAGDGDTVALLSLS